MITQDSNNLQMRVLVLAPTGRDAINSVAVLKKAGVSGQACRDMRELCQCFEEGAGGVILTEESLALDKASCLAQVLGIQPSWSDLPILVLTRGGPESPAAIRAMQSLGNVVLLERPVRMLTLVTAVKTALRARDRQYQIRSQLEQLQQADARKNEFLATLAHELRNPLAPVRTGLRIIQSSGELQGPLAKTRDMMERQVGHMVRLIDDLMDVARITSGKVELRKERLSFDDILETALESSRPQIDHAGHTLTISVPPEPVLIDGDRTRLAQVISNLLNNAAKYTPDGGHIELSAAVDQDALTIRVKDNGIGIPEKMLPQIFEMFTQVGRSIDRAKGGLGIGLTLVRRLLEMHGGAITAESEGAGLGSTFIVTLPIAKQLTDLKSHDSVAGESDRAPIDGLRVLVVDDNVDGAQSLATLLQLSGHQTQTAHNGASALLVAKEFHPEVVFLDIGLPGVNGYEVAKRLRRDTEFNDTTLVALTGWGTEEDKRLAKEAGFNFHLTKPADLNEVDMVLAKVGSTVESNLKPGDRVKHWIE